jgi:fucose 4-O-acetylase-like acetyltransferase
LAITAVAVNHAANWGFIALFWWTDRYRAVAVPNYDQLGSFSYYFVLTLQKLAVFCMPAFLFVTGLFLAYAARGSQSHLTWDVIKKRIFNLLPPYAIWIVVMYLVQYLVGEKRSTLEYLWGLVSIEKSPFFFVPLIIVYYLISPFLVRWIRARMKLVLGVALAVLLMGVIRSYLNVYIRYNHLEETSLATVALFFRQEKIFEYFFYYVFGLIAGFNLTTVKNWIIKYRWMLLIISILMGILAVVEAEWVYQVFDTTSWRSRTLTIPTVIYSIAIVLSFWAFEQVKIPFSNVFYRLGLDTLGIYMIHQIVLLIVPKIVYNFLPFMLAWQVVYLPFLVIVILATPILLMTIVRKLPIRVYTRYIFG